jgi:hypothetical protein
VGRLVLEDLDGLLKEGDVGVLAVGKDLSKSLSSNLLLEGNSGNRGQLIPVVLIILVIVILHVDKLSGNLGLVVSSSEGDDLGNLTLLKVVILSLVQRLEQSLGDISKERLELLSVDLGNGTEEHESSLLHAGVSKVDRVLSSLHERLDVRSKGLKTDGLSHGSHTVNDNSTEVKLLLRVLHLNEGDKSLHHSLEVGGEGSLGGKSSRSDTSNGSRLELKVLLHEHVLELGDQSGEVSLNILLLNTDEKSVDGVASTAPGLRSIVGVEHVDKDGDKSSVLLSELLMEVIGELHQSLKSGLADGRVLVVQKLKNDRENNVELGNNKIGSSLNTVSEGEDTSLAALGVGVLDIAGEGVEEGNNNHGGGKGGGHKVEKLESSASRGHVVRVLNLVHPGDNLHSAESQALTNTEGLNLHLLVAHARKEERKGLDTGVVVNLGGGVDREVGEELDQVAEVGRGDSRVDNKEHLENLESGVGLFLVSILSNLLENSNHSGNELLHSVDSLGVLIGVENLGELSERKKGVQADLNGLGVADSLGEERKEVLPSICNLVLKSLQKSEEDVSRDFTVLDLLGGSSLGKGSGELLPETSGKLNLCDSGDNTSRRVTDIGDGVLGSRDKKSLLDLGLHIIGDLGGGVVLDTPELGDEGTGLNSGELTETLVGVARDDLNKESKGLGVLVVVLELLGRASKVASVCYLRSAFVVSSNSSENSRLKATSRVRTKVS